MKKRDELWGDMASAWPSLMVAIGLGLICAHLITTCGHG